jgi:hypothetical protein
MTQKVSSTAVLLLPTYLEVLINGGEQHLLGVLVGDVLDHQGRPLVLSTCDLLQV